MRSPWRATDRGGRPLIAALLACALLLAVGAPVARADGDPASDVLLAQRVFYPYDPPVSAGLRRALDREVAAAARHGFPLRVAIIATRLDLGAVTVLFDRPSAYADYLERELSYSGPVPLLVVMPAGEAVAGVSERVASTALERPIGIGTDALVGAALGAVRTLSRAAGRPIGAVGAGQGRSGRASAGIIALAAVLLACLIAALVAVRVTRRSSVRAGRHRPGPAEWQRPGPEGWQRSEPARQRPRPEERRRLRHRRRARRRAIAGGVAALAAAGIGGGIAVVVVRSGHGSPPGRAVLSASGVAEGSGQVPTSRPRSSGTAAQVRLGPIPNVRPGPGRVFFSGPVRGLRSRSPSTTDSAPRARGGSSTSWSGPESTRASSPTASTDAAGTRSPARSVSSSPAAS